MLLFYFNNYFTVCLYMFKKIIHFQGLQFVMKSHILLLINQLLQTASRGHFTCIN